MKTNWKYKFVKLMISQGISILGSSVVSLAILWYVTLKTQSGVAVAMVTITTYLPQFLVLLLGGMLADCYSTKKIIIYSDSFIAVSSLALGIIFFTGQDNLTIIFIVNILRSIGTGIEMPAIRSILPEIVPDDYYMKANSINTGMWSLIYLVAPGIGGLILNYLDMSYIMLLDVVTAIIGVGILALIEVERKDKKSEIKSPIGQLKEGWHYIVSENRIRSCILFYAIFQFLVVPASQLTPLLASKNLGKEVLILCSVETAFSVGALIASTIMAVKEPAIRHFLLIGISSVIFGTTMIGVLFAHNKVLFLILMIIMGVGSPLYYSPLVTYIQEYSKEEYMGRVFSYVDLLSTAATPLGMALFGPLANVSIIAAFLIAGSGMVLLGVRAITLNK